MKVIRREANISMGELALYAKVSEYQIMSFENLIVNLNGQALRAVARKLKTTVRELKKYCEVKRTGTNGRNYKYKLIRENVTKEEVTMYASVEYDYQEGKVYNATKITEKPKLEEVKSTISPLGRYVVTPDVFDKIKQHLAEGCKRGQAAHSPPYCG